MKKEFVHGRSHVADALLSEFCKRKTPYNMEAFGIPIQVDDTVYPPETDEITLLYLEDKGTSMLRSGVRVLDFGTGTGILAIFAAKHGAQVTAIDINPKAVQCTQHNCNVNGVADQVQVLLSDGFSNISPDSKFDIILASIPWESSEANNNMEIAFYDPQFKARTNLFETGYHHLHPDGCILISYSRRVEKINPMKTFSDNFDFQIVHQVPATDGNEETYLIKATKK
ncbi:MAG: 50S ribosomal protein L11 methyltransferase [Gammaproteobacteria bacterium]|nr:50S ribosomal protein L11 methyltransferase [Gammaproteobacteria bacterium]